MAKLSREELNEIIERDVPGTRVVESAPGADPRSLRAPADLDSPDIATLREKFLGKGKKKATDARTAAPAKPSKRASRAAKAEDDDDDDVEIVNVAPKRPVEPLDRGSRAKAVVVSSKEKKVIGRQG